ncbi:MAG TPA: hypothetical protein VKR31_07070 [Rhizomicrobium sp.]|nr:hypothetical protein [Rhizomicrobium sp.]
MAGSIEQVVHSFGYGADGSYPFAGLLYVSGMLYGTTSSGGTHIVDGALFQVNPATGAEKVIYSFCSRKNCVDGETPLANLMTLAARCTGKRPVLPGVGHLVQYDVISGWLRRVAV